MSRIGVGDAVMAIKMPGVDTVGNPVQRPVFGQTYTVTAIYRMRYGLGCRLAGLDPRPYNGYLLFVHDPLPGTDMERGWYFAKVEPVGRLQRIVARAKENAYEY